MVARREARESRLGRQLGSSSSSHGVSAESSLGEEEDMGRLRMAGVRGNEGVMA